VIKQFSKFIPISQISKLNSECPSRTHKCKSEENFTEHTCNYKLNCMTTTQN